jgi:hypothetical protein
MLRNRWSFAEFFSDANEEEFSKCTKVIFGSSAVHCDSRKSSISKIFQIIIAARRIQNHISK